MEKHHQKSSAVCISALFALLVLTPHAEGSDTLFLDIPLGQERCQLSGNICITYDSRLSDSRCSIGALCTWAGRAEVRLLVNSDTVVLNTTDSTSKPLKATGYTIQLMEVHPFPILAYPGNLSDHDRYLIDRRDSAVEVALIKSPSRVKRVTIAPVLSRLTISGSNCLAYEIFRASHVEVQIFSLQGKFIKTIVDKESGPGFFRVDFPSSKSNGPYVVKMQTEMGAIVRPVYYTR